MIDVPLLALLRIPDAALIAMDSRAFHFALQPVHFLVRMAHILSVSAFFGGVAVFDLRLMGMRMTLPMKPLAALLMPFLYYTFWAAMLSGVLLFFYNPVHVGSHAFFTLKLLFIVAGMANAWIYQRLYYAAAFAARDTMPRSARLAGGLSLLFWFGVMVCACLNTESVPKVVLR
jgi:hypothetical protein